MSLATIALFRTNPYGHPNSVTFPRFTNFVLKDGIPVFNALIKRLQLICLERKISKESHKSHLAHRASIKATVAVSCLLLFD